MEKKIAVLGANYQYLSFYRQAKALGYKIYAFGKESDDHISATKYAYRFFDISFREAERILEICKKEQVQGVTSFLIESALPFVYYVSRGLGVACNSPECEALTSNKYTMREQMKKHHINIPSYRAICSKNDMADVEFPLIVKPADSGGSRGVTLVRDKKDLSLAIDRALEWSAKGIVMLEQYVDGREFSVESVSYQGQHYILQITDKVTTEAPFFVELAHHQPAQLTAQQRQDIADLTTQTLTAMKIEYGAGHTEIKMDAAGVPFVIETSPRMGGDFISSDLVRMSTGYDFVKGVLEVATGSFTKPHVTSHHHSGVYFLCANTKNKVLPYIQQQEKYPFIVDADIWGDIRSVQCNSDRGGYFIYQAEHKIEI